MFKERKCEQAEPFSEHGCLPNHDAKSEKWRWMSVTRPQLAPVSSPEEFMMSKITRPTSVPKTMQASYDQIVALTDEICRQHLNDEYRDLARAMAAALCRKRPSPVASGQVRSWACGIIYALGKVNFLSDKSPQPFMTMAETASQSNSR